MLAPTAPLAAGPPVTGPDDAVLALYQRPWCPNCRTCPQVIEDSRAGTLVCDRCGLVLDDRLIDTHSEWRTFSDSHDETNDPNRVGGPTNQLFEDSQLSTVIGKVDASGHAISQQHQFKLSGGTSASDRNLQMAIREIDGIGEHMALSEPIKDSAKKMYKEVEERSPMRGLESRNITAAVAAVVYIACRQSRASRTFKEVCQQSGVPKRDITRAYKHIVKTLNLGHDDLSVSNPDMFLPRFCSNLRLPAVATRGCREVAERIASQGLMEGRTPLSVCAVAIYYVVNILGGPHLRTPKAIADVTGMAESTLHGAYRSLYPHLPSIFPESLGVPRDRLEQLPKC